jgi:hypothetical protein
MKKDIVTRMCEDLLELSQILDEPLKSKVELYDEIGVPFSGVNINNEETEPPRADSNTSLTDSAKRGRTIQKLKYR